jgi:RNAse (barnase) inhibitor barstar
MNLSVQRTREIIFWFLGMQKWDLDEFEEAMFQVVKWPSELIICHLDVSKCDFGKVYKAIIQLVESPKNSFPTFLPLQVTTWLKSIKRCFLVRHNQIQDCRTFGRPKMRLSLDRESDVWSGRMVLRTQYLPSGCPKIRLVWIRKCNFPCVEIPCKIVFCLLGIQKCYLDEVEEAMFQVVLWSWELIICLLHVAKCDLGKVDKAIFQVVEKQIKTHFSVFWPPQNTTYLKSIKRCTWFRQTQRQDCLLSAKRNCDFGNFEKVIFQMAKPLRTQYLPSACLKIRVVWIWGSEFSCCPKSMRNHFLTSGHKNMRLGRVRGKDVSSSRMDLRTHYLPSGCVKMRNRWSR